MQFVDLPEPHISCSHVLARTPLLYRFDARDESASLVVTEYLAPRLPHIAVNGPPSEARAIFDAALKVLGGYGPNTPNTNIGQHLMPLFTLEIRPRASFLASIEITLNGFFDGSVTCVTHGSSPALYLTQHVKAVYQRLTELGRVYYRT